MKRWQQILLLIITWKVVDTVVSTFAIRMIPYYGNFSYGREMYQYGLPAVIRLLTNFDGTFYVRIATQGYSFTEHAYFPLYPLLISLVNRVIGNPIVAGLLISLGGFFVALSLWRQLAPRLARDPEGWWAVLFLLLHPFSYYFGVLYTEGLFLGIFVACLYFLEKRRYVPLFVLGYFLGLTRVIGVFLAIAIVVAHIPDLLKRARAGWLALWAAGGPVLGLMTYMAYLWRVQGDPLMFFHAQEYFSNNRSSHLVLPLQVLYRYIKIFLTADWSFQYFVAGLEALFFVVALAILTLDLIKQIRLPVRSYLRLGLNLFSFANLLVPSMTGTLSAIPRYSLVSLSLVLFLAEIPSRRTKIALLTLFGVAHLIFFGFFIQGYYLT